MRPIGILASSWLALVATLGADAQEYNPVRKPSTAQAQSSTHRVMVMMRSTSSTARVQAQAAQNAVQALATRSKLNLKNSYRIAANVHVMHVEPQTSGQSIQETLERLRADSAVQYVQADRWNIPLATPNDPLFAGQWWLQSAQPAAVNAVSAWDVTTGSNGVIVAVLDTGIRYGHPDLRVAGSGDRPNRLLPGYDFVSPDNPGVFFTANDGDGPDADPSDPGDWITTAESSINCDAAPSSWHGSRVAGMIGALSNNNSGVSGLTWSGWILPVRVLGKCGGYDSDILAAMRWAAGLNVPGVPDNQYPANIENLSLGAAGPCGQVSQAVVNEVTAKGVLVVVSAGNDGGPVSSPANCNGVAAVLGLRHVGTKVGFSSLGPEIAVGAPGGNCVNTGAGQPCLFSLDTTSNSGQTVPSSSTYTDQTNTNLGTSFSAPIVSGIASLMLSVNGNLSPRELIKRLKDTATQYPGSSDPNIPQCRVPTGFNDIQDEECVCNTSACGAGMANAAAAVNEALRPVAVAAFANLSPGTSIPAGDVVLSGAQSTAACKDNRTVTSYSWSIVGSSSPPTSNQTRTVTVPASGTITVRLTVTDNLGATNSVDLPLSAGATVTANAPSKPACLTPVTFTAADSTDDAPSSSDPPPSSTPPSQSDDGGGGALDELMLLASALALMCALRYRPRRRSAVSSQVF